MAYNIIPTSTTDIQKNSAFKDNDEYIKVYSFLFSKFKKKDPIALSVQPNEKKQVKITRSFQGVISLPQLKEQLKIKNISLSFGEGSRGGRGTANKGAQFEKDLTNDFNTWWKDEKKYKNVNNKKVIEEVANQYKWNKVKTFKAEQLGVLNQKRPLMFRGADVAIGTFNDPNIGKTVTDITVTTDKKPTYFSLKATGTVTFFNAGVSKILNEQELKQGTVKNKDGLALLKILGINPAKFAAVFNSYGGKLQRYQENVTKKIDRPRLIKMLQSGIGYGYHYIHAKKPTEIHHFKMTKQFMQKLAMPMTAIAYYGGKTSAGKRVDIDVDTPLISLKFNIRNKQGGVYPTHIMCDYSFKKYK